MLVGNVGRGVPAQRYWSVRRSLAKKKSAATEGIWSLELLVHSVISNGYILHFSELHAMLELEAVANRDRMRLEQRTVFPSSPRTSDRFDDRNWTAPMLHWGHSYCAEKYWVPLEQRDLYGRRIIGHRHHIALLSSALPCCHPHCSSAGGLLDHAV